VVQALLDVASPLGPRLEAITGFIAVVVLLVVLNWFVHTVYWSQWIGRHHRQRRKLLARSGAAATLGLVALGFTALSFQDLGWLPRHETPFTLPEWMGSWFEMYSTWETLGVQLLAG